MSDGSGQGQVIHDVSMRVEAGPAVAVLGSNGAGKSMLMATLSGVLPRPSVSIRRAGKELVAAPCHEIVSRGLVQVPEGRRALERQRQPCTRLGLAPRVVDEIRQAQGVTILLVEQTLDIALDGASRAYVLIKERVRRVEDPATLARRQNLSQL